VDVRAEDVRDAQRAHFFAGIGCWDYALKLAGWRSDLVVWSGSCPCQPFSQASPNAQGFDDERHLWPAWFKLIEECRPAVVFGEQVGSPAGLAWLDAVQADLEGAGYAVGAADLCAAGVGAPHRRQRLYFVAIRSDVADAQRVGCGPGRIDRPHGRAPLESDRHGEARELADDDDEAGCSVVGRSELPDVGDAARGHNAHGADRARDPWAGHDWIWCSDGRWRPVPPAQSGIQPLVDGSAFGVGQRAGRLRAYGNAIVPQVAAAFIETVLDFLRI